MYYVLFVSLYLCAATGFWYGGRDEYTKFAWYDCISVLLFPWFWTIFLSKKITLLLRDR